MRDSLTLAEDVERGRLLEECALDPTVFDRNSIITRSYQNKKRVRDMNIFSRLYHVIGPQTCDWDIASLTPVVPCSTSHYNSTSCLHISAFVSVTKCYDSVTANAGTRTLNRCSTPCVDSLTASADRNRNHLHCEGWCCLEGLCHFTCLSLKQSCMVHCNIWFTTIRICLWVVRLVSGAITHINLWWAAEFYSINVVLMYHKFTPAIIECEQLSRQHLALKSLSRSFLFYSWRLVITIANILNWWMNKWTNEWMNRFNSVLESRQTSA